MRPMWRPAAGFKLSKREQDRFRVRLETKDVAVAFTE